VSCPGNNINLFENATIRIQVAGCKEQVIGDQLSVNYRIQDAGFRIETA